MFGFNKRIWRAEEFKTAGGAGVRLSYLSKDGEENYPGNLSVTVFYTLTDQNEFKIEYEAATDRDTIINLTHHSYFNLAGKGSALNHKLKIYADRFTPVDETLIPTGELRPVKNSPFDFTDFHSIGSRIDAQDEQLRIGKGYDHNFVLNNRSGKLALAAEVYDPVSGRRMQVYTTEPGLQFYSGNYLNNTKGKLGEIYQSRDGFCLEAQHFPDFPNHPQFPSTVLKKGEQYSQTIVYKFSAK